MSNGESGKSKNLKGKQSLDGVKLKKNPGLVFCTDDILKDPLFAPSGYWSLTKWERYKICNQAGPKGYGWLVPDTIWGLDIGDAADIHDYMYHFGKTIDDKNEADRVFLNNMIRIILNETRYKVLQWLRLKRAQKYFNAVCLFGGPSFWSGKNKSDEESFPC